MTSSDPAVVLAPAEIPEPSIVDELCSNSDRRLVAAGLLIMMLAQLWSFAVDAFGPPTGEVQASRRLLVRGVSLAVCAFGAWSVRRVRTRREYSMLVLNLSLALAVVLLALNLMRPQGGELNLRGPLIGLVLFYGAMPNTFRYQLVPAALFGLGVIGERLFWLTTPTGGAAAKDVMILILVNVIGALMTYRRVRLERELYFADLAKARALDEVSDELVELRARHGIKSGSHAWA